MPENKKLIVTLILGVLIGVALISLMGTSFSVSITIPSGHQAVANQVFINDNGASYTPVCISTGKTPSLSIIPMTFTGSGEIPYSIWGFRSDAANTATTYAFMTIYGPDNTGNVYWVQISRASPNALSLSYPTGNFDFTANSNQGYVYFEVTS